MEKSTKITLKSGTIRNLLAGVLFAVLAIVSPVGIRHTLLHFDLPTALAAACLFVIPFMLCVSMSSTNFLVYLRRTSFNLYELQAVDAAGAQRAMKELRNTHIVCQKRRNRIIFVRREDFGAYSDWSLLHYRAKFAAPKAGQ